ncbi:MAG: hypothetical protein HS116_10055 [Planctomycetes bacterium]|nr:hypothetical protein [Planctomycetota bacterium]
MAEEQLSGADAKRLQAAHAALVLARRELAWAEERMRYLHELFGHKYKLHPGDGIRADGRIERAGNQEGRPS